MTDSYVLANKIELTDRWNGSANPAANSVIGMTAGTYGAPDGYSQNVASLPSGMTLGMQIKGRNDGSVAPAGEYTLTYLKFGTKLTASTPVAGHLCVPFPATTAIPDYIVSNDTGAGAFLNGAVAVLLGAPTANYYGWFWTGGVIPDFLFRQLASDQGLTAPFTKSTAVKLTTDGNVTADHGLSVKAANGDDLAGTATGITRTANAAVFGIQVTLTPGCGFSLAADA